MGWLVDRWQPRRVILIGSAATVIGYLLLAGVQELWQFLALMAALAFFRAWIFYVPFTILISDQRVGCVEVLDLDVIVTAHAAAADTRAPGQPSVRHVPPGLRRGA